MHDRRPNSARPNGAESIPAATIPAVELETVEAQLADAYESAFGLGEAGIADWQDLGEPIAQALATVRGWLAEAAA